MGKLSGKSKHFRSRKGKPVEVNSPEERAIDPLHDREDCWLLLEIINQDEFDKSTYSRTTT